MDRLDRLEKELAALEAVVSRLRSEVAVLREAQSLQRHPVEACLWQRGFPVLVHGEGSQVALPPHISPDRKRSFYELMRRYSFRLFLRDLIQFPEGKNIEALSRYCSLKTVRSYLRSLSEIDIVRTSPDGSYRLISKHISSFGPTLEWYVNEIFQREFMAPSIFNVRLDHTHYGGDYDVIALFFGRLAYVEVKSSPPRGVEIPAVSAFLSRLRDLRPHVAIFLVDTELRMRDKIVPLFAEAFSRLSEDSEKWPVARLVDEIFHVCHGIYLINSRKGIYSNLRVCFRDFLHHENEARLPLDVSGVKGEE